MVDADGGQVHYRKGTQVMVIRAFDGRLFCCVNDTDVHALEEVPKRQSRSRDLDPDYEEPKPKKTYIPPMSHPWKQASFRNFVNRQSHHLRDASESA